jgi:hypothetical protein
MFTNVLKPFYSLLFIIIVMVIDLVKDPALNTDTNPTNLNEINIKLDLYTYSIHVYLTVILYKCTLSNHLHWQVCDQRAAVGK